MSDPVSQLRIYGRDLANSPFNRLPKEIGKVCFICVNSYRSFRQNIGITPLGDAVSMAKCLKYFEYSIFYVANPHAKFFLDYLDYFFEHTTEHLIVYYVGQGTTVEDLDTTTKRELYEAFTFEDGKIMDGEMAEHIKFSKNPDNIVTLITDTCRPNTCWSLISNTVDGVELPPRIMSLSASPTPQTSKSMMALAQSQGIFTFNLTKELKKKPKATPKEIEKVMNEVLKEFAQIFTSNSTSPELLDEPLLHIDFE
ncbi:hypothetical protein M9Y10_040727 [Tritrichomonas musculus]|uniref:Peptidase C14 caspase domain-containing protein n=1 Tax=Tritrichomonas musculus TaxID=1915356 RepID=A0ABR2K2D2_9EUKA